MAKRHLDPDETEGRRRYRALADTAAAWSINRARVKLITECPPCQAFAKRPPPSVE